MNIEDLKNVKAPFDIVNQKGERSTVVGFSQNDPLGVGGGIFPDMPVAYFKGGGWLLVSDLVRYHELAPNKASTRRGAGARSKRTKSVAPRG